MRGRNPPRDNREGTTRWRRIGRGRYNRPLPHCIPSRRVVPIHAKKNPRGTGGQSPPAYRRKHRQKPIDINLQRQSPDSITKLENRAIKYRARSHQAETTHHNNDIFSVENFSWSPSFARKRPWNKASGESLSSAGGEENRSFLWVGKKGGKRVSN